MNLKEACAAALRVREIDGIDCKIRISEMDSGTLLTIEMHGESATREAGYVVKKIIGMGDFTKVYPDEKFRGNEHIAQLTWSDDELRRIAFYHQCRVIKTEMVETSVWSCELP